MFDIPPQRCFGSAQELAAAGRVAEAVINATMDTLHVPTAVPTLQAGCHLLLEKPIATSQADLLELLATARRTGRTVMICHVLRYAPFYVEIKKRLEAGVIGELLNIQTAEYVSYHHMATAFVRGKWRRRDQCGSAILMSKCCHDLDLIVWLAGGRRPARVGSFGALSYFRPENAPKGAGNRCLLDCSIEQACPYSARKLYLQRRLWCFYTWEGIEELGGADASEQDKIDSLRRDNPYGRCVWRCDNDVFDHQTVIVQFEDGVTATHNLIGGTPRGCRTILLSGTAGEIEGNMEAGTFTIRRPDPSAPAGHTTEEVDVRVTGDMHGGGDLRLVADFVHTLMGHQRSISCTALEDSIYGHLIGFAADQSIRQGRIVDVPAL
ncbi:MAG: hypothetical protein B1H04_06305 [Planctomycetales bacterium 4484_123]|nr:MAG: hypothetical protein B1H04_06305 [Planctomycetales bacterium 4484_123]